MAWVDLDFRHAVERDLFIYLFLCTHQPLSSYFRRSKTCITLVFRRFEIRYIYIVFPSAISISALGVVQFCDCNTASRKARSLFSVNHAYRWAYFVGRGGRREGERALALVRK